ncbi:hypothetical protein ACH4UM_21300 [Streptomyces sp. NPDC020801]|uniref:hypothetical protein n=1 Tax=unclassified Streptomyces TaxID=2593676 RepID=UPI00379B35CC
MQEERRAARTDLLTAHFGLAIVLIASSAVALLADHLYGIITVAAFGVLFSAALVVMLLRGLRVAAAARRAYVFTFTWTHWF